MKKTCETTPTTTSCATGLNGKVAVITGAGGAICGAIARALSAHGASAAIWDLSEAAAQRQAQAIKATGGSALAVTCDVLDRSSIEHAMQATLAEFQTVDILINGAGGSRREATTASDLSFFDMVPEALMKTIALNYSSAVLPSQVIGRLFAKQKHGVILNIASIAGIRPLTRAIGYSNGKAALINFTQWLAVHMAQEYSPHIRVNALAPGFVLTEQNRFLLTDEKTGQPTERGRQIIRHVPMGRLAEPEEMAGAALWLVSDNASFVTGAVIPVDGGFTAISGV